MSAIPSKTGVPDIINNRLGDTIDFFVASTNFTSILDSYTNLLAFNMYYNSLKYECDPITAEAEFWRDFTNDSIDLQKVARNPRAIKYLKRVEVKVKDGDDLKVDSSGNPISYIDSKGNLVTETINGDILPLTTDNTQYVNDKVAAVAVGNWDDVGTIDSGEFYNWWLDKFNKAHFKVKEEFAKMVNIEDSAFQQFSESIGLLGWQHQFPQSRYMHYADEDSDPTPFPFNSVIDDKLEFEYKQNVLNLSRRTEAIFKRNMRQVISTADIGTDAHKENLVTDHFHYKRLKENHHELNEIVSNTLGWSYQALVWISSHKLSNKQVNVPAVFELVVENSIEEVDILLNKIHTLTNPISIDTLKS